MHTYTEIFPPTLQPYVDSVARLNKELGDAYLSLVNNWLEVHREIGGRLMSLSMLGADAPARFMPGESAPAPSEADMPAQFGRGADGQDQAGTSAAEDDAAEAPRNAALAILTNPALAAATAAQADASDDDNPGDEDSASDDDNASDDDSASENVSDDDDDTTDPVAEDIAHEIDREAAIEAAHPPSVDRTANLP